MDVIFPKGTPRNVQDGVSQFVNKEDTNMGDLLDKKRDITMLDMKYDRVVLS